MVNQDKAIHMKRFVFPRFIQFGIVCMGLFSASICRGIEVELKYVAHPWAGFVYYLSQDRSLVSLVRELHLCKYTFPEELLSCRDDSHTLEEEQFFSDLIKVTSIDGVANMLNTIEDVNQRKTILLHINQAYQNYQQLNTSLDAVKLLDYTQRANQYATDQIVPLQNFFGKVAAFYGIATPTWSGQYLVYPYMATNLDLENQIISFYNIILYPLVHTNEIEVDFKSLLLTCIKRWCEKKGALVQLVLYRFFPYYHSPYTYFTKIHLDEALSHSLAKYYTVHYLKKTDASNLLQENMGNFVNAIYPKVAHYLANSRPLDLSFCKKMVSSFAVACPQTIYDLNQVLKRCVVVSKHFKRDKVLEILRSHFHIGSAFYGCRTLPIRTYIENGLGIGKGNAKAFYEYDYDDCIPIVAVVSSKEIMDIAQFLKDYVCFRALPNSYFKRIKGQKGVYILRTKSGKIYFLFIVNHYGEVSKLAKMLQEKQLLSQEDMLSMLSMVLSD